MTGTTNRRGQFRAVFLAAIMVMSMVALGAAGFAGSAAATSGDDIDVGFSTDTEEADVIAGSGNQTAGVFVIEDQGGDEGAIASRTIVTLPDGMTISDHVDEEDIVLSTSTGSTVDATDISITEDRTEFRIEHDGTSSTGDQVRVGGLEFTTEADFDAAFDGSVTAGVNVNYALDQEEIDIFNVYKPQLDSSETDVGAGASTSLADDVTVSTGDGDAGDKQIGAGTDIVISANETEGYTFNVGESNTDGLVDGISSEGDIDVDNIELTETQLILPVNETFDDDSVLSLNSGQIEIQAAPDAAESSVLELSTEAEDSTGVVQGDTDATLALQTPTLQYFADGEADAGIAVGADGQTVDLDAAALTGSSETDASAQVRIEATADDQIVAGENVTLQLNNSAVSFDEDQAEDIVVREDQADPGTDIEADVHIENQILTFEVPTDEGLDNGEAFIIGYSDDEPTDDPLLTFDVDGDINGDEHVAIDLLTGEDEVTSTEANDNVLKTVEPDVAVAQRSDDEHVIFSDNIDREQIPVDDNAGDAITISTNDADLDVVDPGTVVYAGSNSNITVSLEEGTGVTWDKSFEGWDFGPENNVVVEDNELIFVEVGEQTFGDDSEIGDLQVNATAVAEDTAVDITFESDDEYTTPADKDLEVLDASPDDIDADAEFDGTFGQQLTATPDAGDEVTSAVQVENSSSTGTAFGGADVSLNATSEDGEDINNLLNTTSITTDADGIAAFEFTADLETGEHVVNATIDETGESVEITYDVGSSGLAEMEVTGEEDAFAGGTSDEAANLLTGVYQISLTDQFGNAVDDLGVDPIEFRVVTDNSNVVNVWVSDGIDDGQPTDLRTAGPVSPGDTIEIDNSDVNDGELYIFVDNDGLATEDVEIEVRPRGDFSDEVDRDSGTSTFFSSAQDANIELAEDTVEPGAEVDANATLFTDDGDLITVPRVEGDFEVGNDTVAEFQDTNAVTDTDGIATGTLDALDNGTTSVNVTEFRGQEASTELTVAQETEDDDDELVDAPGGVQIPAKYLNDEGRVTSAELLTAGTDFQNGEIDGPTLLDIGTAFQNS